MANQSLNPAVISVPGNAMPTFDVRAQYTQPTQLAGSYPMSSSVPNGSNFVGSGLVGSAIGAAAGLIGGALDRKFEREQAALERD